MSTLETIRRVVISFFLAAYILTAIIAGAFPSPLTVAWGQCLKPVFAYWGLYHNYGMFAPDPIDYNQTFRAIVKFRDGSIKDWRFPSLPDFKNDDLTRQRKLPWVEWQCYFAFDPANIIIVKDAARYVAWLHRNPTNPPVEVEIVRDSSKITVGDDTQHKRETVQDSFLRYDVSEEDLQ
jgi:hypothetical protein